MDDWSAGCQVIPGGRTGKHWREFWRLIEQSEQSRFEYFLIDGKHLKNLT